MMVYNHFQINYLIGINFVISMLSFAASFVILFIVTIDNFFSHIFDIVSFFSGNDNNGGDEDADE